jgi:hypothetical protein
MAQVARAATAAAGGGPERLTRLSVQFRGMGLPGEEITVTGTVESVADGVATIRADAEQAGNRIIRNAEADVRV